MRMIVRGIGVIAAVLVGYNALIFVVIASGRHVDYVPWLHFPIKLFQLVAS